MNTTAASADRAAGAGAGAGAGADAALVQLRRRHWRKTRLVTAALLGVWLLMILGLGLFARDLAQVSFFGWPLSFYMGAQGALIVFLLIIGCHCVVMNRLDHEVQQAEQRNPVEPR